MYILYVRQIYLHSTASIRIYTMYNYFLVLEYISILNKSNLPTCKCYWTMLYENCNYIILDAINTYTDTYWFDIQVSDNLYKIYLKFYRDEME